ncbi:MAG: hypothetical protein V3S12_06135 [Acidiferrobacterales bacterium]
MDQVDSVLEPIKYFTSQLAFFLPKLLIAVAVLVMGWLFAKLFYSVVVKSLKAINFESLTHKSGVDAFLKHGGIAKTTSEILGLLIYWVIILITLLVASNIVELDVVSELFSQVLQFIPNIFVALLILTFGMYFARFVSDIVTAYSKNVGFQDAELVGRLARYAIITFVIIIALEQMDIGTTIPRSAFLILLGGVVFAFSLAFGLGGQKWAASQFDKLMDKEKARKTRASADKK